MSYQLMYQYQESAHGHVQTPVETARAAGEACGGSHSPSKAPCAKVIAGGLMASLSGSVNYYCSLCQHLLHYTRRHHYTHRAIASCPAGGNRVPGRLPLIRPLGYGHRIHHEPYSKEATTKR
jgi:hypothetical protein